MFLNIFFLGILKYVLADPAFEAHFEKPDRSQDPRSLKQETSKVHFISKRMVPNEYHNPKSSSESISEEESDVDPKQKLEIPVHNLFQSQSPDLNIPWGICSEENIEAYICSDVSIICEFWAPLGSNFSWYKDNVLQISQKHHQYQSNEIVSFNDTQHEKSSEVLLRYKYAFLLMTSFYIDCVSYNASGLYSLVVETPNGNNYVRNFNVTTKDIPIWYLMECLHCTVSIKRLNLKVVDFAKAVVGKRGSELFLPCRFNDVHHIKTVWNKADQEFTPYRFSITEIGDLRIENVSLSDVGTYTCTIYHYNGIEYDQIFTYLEIID